MAGCCEPPVGRLYLYLATEDWIEGNAYEVDCHTEATSSLKLTDLDPSGNIVPYVNTSIERRAGKILPIF